METGRRINHNLERRAIADFKCTQTGYRVQLVCRTGTKIGIDGYLRREYLSLQVVRPDGSRVYKSNTPYWLFNSGPWAYHYKSGFSRADQQSYDAAIRRMRSLAADIAARGNQGTLDG